MLQNNSWVKDEISRQIFQSQKLVLSVLLSKYSVLATYSFVKNMYILFFLILELLENSAGLFIDDCYFHNSQSPSSGILPELRQTLVLVQTCMSGSCYYFSSDIIVYYLNHYSSAFLLHLIPPPLLLVSFYITFFLCVLRGYFVLVL